MMEDAIDRLSVRPVANQVEFHPFLDTEKLLAASARQGLPLTAYCAVARGKMATSSLLDDIGRSHGKSGTQVGLRWTLQKGVAINAMSTRAENLRLNFDLLAVISQFPNQGELRALDDALTSSLSPPSLNLTDVGKILVVSDSIMNCKTSKKNKSTSSWDNEFSYFSRKTKIK